MDAAENKKFAFHEIEATIQAIYAAQDEAENPDDPGYREALELALAELADARSEKVDALAWVMAGMDAEIERIKITTASMESRRRSLENRIANLKGYILSVMQAHDLKKIKGQSATFSIRQGKESVSVSPDAIESLPFDLVRTKVEPDKGKIMEALRDGREVPGAQLVTGPATLAVRR